MNKSKHHFKRHSRVLFIFMQYVGVGIIFLLVGISILMNNRSKIMNYAMSFMSLFIAVPFISLTRLHWEVHDEVIKENEKKCGYYTFQTLCFSFMLFAIPFILLQTKINVASLICFVVAYANFLYFAIYALIAHKQKKLSLDIADDLPPSEEERKRISL